MLFPVATQFKPNQNKPMNTKQTNEHHNGIHQHIAMNNGAQRLQLAIKELSTPAKKRITQKDSSSKMQVTYKRSKCAIYIASEKGAGYAHFNLHSICIWHFRFWGSGLMLGILQWNLFPPPPPPPPSIL